MRGRHGRNSSGRVRCAEGATLRSREPNRNALGSNGTGGTPLETETDLCVAKTPEGKKLESVVGMKEARPGGAKGILGSDPLRA